MAEAAGYLTQIKVSGVATSMVGEATTEDVATKVYQITAAAKQVLDRTATIRVHLQGADGTAEADTTTTTIKMTAHGLVVGDLICNETRSNAYRLVVTRPDVNTITVAAVTDQAVGDTIATYKTEASTAYSLNRLNGTVTYADALSRVIKISGDYLPMTIAAYANSMSRSEACDMLDVTKFGDTYKKRMAGLKSASGTLTQFHTTDTTFTDALTAGAPVVIEDRDAAASEPNRFWAMLESDEVAAAVEGLINEIVSWVSYDAWIKLGG
jgi:Neuraminidase (sialidase)